MLLVNHLTILMIPSLINEPDRIFDVSTKYLSCAPFGKLYFHFYNIVYIKFMRTELKNLIQPYHYYISLVLIFLRAGLNNFFYPSNGETT